MFGVVAVKNASFSCHSCCESRKKHATLSGDGTSLHTCRVGFWGASYKQFLGKAQSTKR